MPTVSLQSLCRTHRPPGGAPVAAVRDLSLDVAEGEYVVLLGPSGSGKTSTLRLIAGLDEPDAGTVTVDGRDMRGVAAKDRGIGMVFQDHPLLPHLSVRDNLAFGPRLQKIPALEIAGRIAELTEPLGLGPLLDRAPDTLSGGERQRVALAAALVRAPRLLLLDEPLGQLDAPLRVQLRGTIRRLQRERGLTVVHVTHDQAEAMALADRLVILHQGRCEQIATPRDAYHRPANLFVARFLGSPPMNLLRGTVHSASGQTFWRSPSGLRWPATPVPAPSEGGILLGVRPESVRLAPLPPVTPSTPTRPPFRVEAVEFLGDHALVRIRLGSEILLARVGGETRLRDGQPIEVSFDPDAIHFFDAAGGGRFAPRATTLIPSVPRTR